MQENMEISKQSEYKQTSPPRMSLLGGGTAPAFPSCMESFRYYSWMSSFV